jgi:hypothetical protein
MPLFDFYIMVDWSGGARRRGDRSDTIWIAHGRRTADTPLPDSPRSRTEAIALIEPVLERAIRSEQRVLLCFDLAYGYPVDFAPALQAATGKSDRDLPWIAVWRYLSEQLKDDEGTAPGAKPTSPKKVRPTAKTAPKPAPVSKRAPEAVRPPPSRPAQPVSSEQRIGVVTHYYSHVSVVAMQLEPGAMLRVGDVIHIRGHTTDFTQRVESLEVNHASVDEARPNDDFGLKVIDQAREHDVVFKVGS